MLNDKVDENSVPVTIICRRPN